MATDAPTRSATRNTPLFSSSTPTLHASRTPHWNELAPELQRALVGLLTQMIGNHLPVSPARDERGGADDPC